MCMTGAGRGNGEPHETFNAEFGPLGSTTQYMTRPNREVWYHKPVCSSMLVTCHVSWFCCLLLTSYALAPIGEQAEHADR